MDFKPLVQQYASGNLVPIIGCEMLPIKRPGRSDLNIHDYIVWKQSDEDPSIFDDIQSPPRNFPRSLYDLQLNDRRFNQNDIIGFLKAIPQTTKDLTLLDKLARMREFRLFIMASMFKDFEGKFHEWNPGISLQIKRNDDNNSTRLASVDIKDMDRMLVYLFEREDSTMFAINDEERLEYLFSLARTSAIESSLIDFLKGKTLLFLGCDFSDWFMRYCIRVLYNQPYRNGPRVYIVNNRREPSIYQEVFFSKYGIELIHQYPVAAFIDELFSKTEGVQIFNDLFKGKSVFISYSHRDEKVANEVNNCLRSKGINTWFDTYDKRIGAHERIIRAQISDPRKTTLMLSIISKGLADDVEDKSKFCYVRDVEWDTADTRIKGAKNQGIEDNFQILPFFIDDYRSYLGDLPPNISSRFRFTLIDGWCDDLSQNIIQLFTQ